MMGDAWFHPRFETLAALRDGSLEPGRQRRVRRHLERCVDCRRSLTYIGELEETIRRVGAPRVDPELLARIHERRAEGIATILPEAARLLLKSRIRGSIVGPTIALVIAGLAGALLVTRAAADRSALAVGPPSSNGGSSLRYSPGTSWPADSVVRVRVEAWYADESRPPTIVRRALHRRGSEFVGSVRLPPGAAYGLAAVEDATARRIDINHGRLWDIWAEPHEERTLPARLAQLRALERLREEGLIRTAVLRERAARMTAARPSSARAWSMRAFYDLADPGVGPEERQELLALHHDKLRVLFRESSREGSTADLPDLLEYARRVDDAVLEEQLVDRLAAIDPDHPRLSERRTRLSVQALARSPSDLLDALETEWELVGSENRVLAPLGYQMSRGVGDPGLVARWAERLYRADPASRDGIARQLAAVSGLELLAIAKLTERLESWSAARGETRPLYQTVDEFEAVRTHERARLLGALGLAQSRAGPAEEAERSLDESLRTMWDPAVATRLLTLLENAGDASTDRAAALRALLAADPLAEDPEIDADEVSAKDLARARMELLATVRSGARRVPSPAALMAHLPDTPASLVAVWRAVPSPEHPLLRELSSAATAVAGAGGTTALLAPGRDRDRATETAGVAGVVPLLDADDIIEAIGAWHAREYLVVNGEETWIYHDLTAALRSSLLLLSNRTN